MENTNKPSVFKLSPEAAKIIVKKHFYYNAHQEESEFSGLPGHLQRAINREVEFHVKTLSQTEGFADLLNADNFKEAQNLHNVLCEYYAHLGNQELAKNPYNRSSKFAALLAADSEAIQKQNGDVRSADYRFAEKNNLDKTTRHADSLNHRIAARKAKGVNHDAAATLQNIYSYVKGHSNG